MRRRCCRAQKARPPSWLLRCHGFLGLVNNPSADVLAPAANGLAFTGNRRGDSLTLFGGGRADLLTLFGGGGADLLALFDGGRADLLTFPPDGPGRADYSMPDMAAAVTPASITRFRAGSGGLRVLIIVLSRGIVRCEQFARRRHEQQSEPD